MLTAWPTYCRRTIAADRPDRASPRPRGGPRRVRTRGKRAVAESYQHYQLGGGRTHRSSAKASAWNASPSRTPTVGLPCQGRIYSMRNTTSPSTRNGPLWTRRPALWNASVLAVADITVLQDVNIGVAAQEAARICRLEVGPLALLGTSVDRFGTTETVCTALQGPIRLVQNHNPGNAP